MASEEIQLIKTDDPETENRDKKKATSGHKSVSRNNSNAGSKRSDKNNRGDKKRNNHHRRKPSKKKRKWKPYSKMTWEEKKAVEEREKLRADRIRGEMLDRGRPVAPYNTTQFIMAEHDPYEEDSVLDSGYKGNDSSNQGLNDEDLDESVEAEYTDSPHMAPEFISQDFSEAYERVQEESLSNMTRDDLVKEHLSLERNLSYLQGKLAEEKRINNSYSVKVGDLEEELEKLRKENERLVQENMRLVYGNDAEENPESGLYQTSDYEYEVPTSDQDAIKCSEDYNDVSEQRTETNNGGDRSTNDDCSCPSSCSRRSSSSNLSSSPEIIESRRSGVRCEKPESSLDLKYENERTTDQVEIRQLEAVPPSISLRKRKLEQDGNVASSLDTCLESYPPNSKTKIRSSTECAPTAFDLNMPETNLQDPNSEETFRPSSEGNQDADNDVIMQSLNSEESMEAATNN